MFKQPILLSSLFQWCAARYRENKLPFLTFLITGLLCHMYAFTNKLLIHDEVQCLFEKGATVDSGRWGLDAMNLIFPNYSMPWIYGIVTLVLIGAAACGIIRILSIRSGCLQALLAGLIAAFPSLTGTFSFMFTSSSYGVAFLLAVLAVGLLRRTHWLFWAAALVSMVLSLSIYQAYISIAAGLLVIVLIADLLRDSDVIPVVRRGVGYVLFLTASLGIYYGLTQIMLMWKGVAFNSYASGNLGFSIAGIPSAIKTAYGYFLLFFTEGNQGLIPTDASRVLHFVCLAAIALMVLLWLLQTREPHRILLVLFLLFLFPLAVNCMYLFTTDIAIHTMVLYGFICFYALAAVFADHLMQAASNRQTLRWLSVNALTVAMALIVVCNIYVANQFWLKLQLQTENTYAFYTSLIADMQSMDLLHPDTRIALIGTYRKPDFYDAQFPHLRAISGARGMLPDSYSKARFLEYYIGVPISFVPDDQIAEISALPEVAAMPAYPYSGSIAQIRDTVVVKLSEP